MTVKKKKPHWSTLPGNEQKAKLWRRRMARSKRSGKPSAEAPVEAFSPRGKPKFRRMPKQLRWKPESLLPVLLAWLYGFRLSEFEAREPYNHWKPLVLHSADAAAMVRDVEVVSPFKDSAPADAQERIFKMLVDRRVLLADPEHDPKLTTVPARWYLVNRRSAWKLNDKKSSG